MLNPRHTAAAFALFTCIVAPAARGAELAPVPAVQRWDDLAKVAPLDLGGGVRVRIAVDTDRAAAGGHVVLYCLTEGLAFDPGKLGAHEPPRDDAVGPVRFKVEPDGEQVIQQKLQRLAQKAQVAYGTLPRVEHAELLYSRLIATPDAGRLRLTVSRADGTQLARTVVVVEKEPAAGWTPLHVAWGEGVTADDAAAGVRVCVRNAASPAAQPQWLADRPILWRGVVDGEAYKRDGESALPSLRETDALKLSHDRGVLRLKMAAPVWCRADLNLLARWWVNDKPVPAPVLAEQARASSGAINEADDYAMRLTFDPEKVGAKSGDQVAVQIAWCEQGWIQYQPAAEHVSATPRLDVKGPGPVWVSNKVEFRVP